MTLGNAARLARWGIPGVIGLDRGQGIPLPHGARATFTPARHFAARTPFDHGRSLWGGFALELPWGSGCVLSATPAGGRICH